MTKSKVCCSYCWLPDCQPKHSKDLTKESKPMPSLSKSAADAKDAAEDTEDTEDTENTEDKKNKKETK